MPVQLKVFLQNIVIFSSSHTIGHLATCQYNEHENKTVCDTFFITHPAPYTYIVCPIKKMNVEKNTYLNMAILQDIHKVEKFCS